MSQRRIINPGEIREERELCNLRPSTVRRMKKSAIRVARHEGKREEREAAVEIQTVLLGAVRQHNLLIGRMTSAHAHYHNGRHHIEIYVNGVRAEGVIGNGGEL